jgi:hypothetical protein
MVLFFALIDMLPSDLRYATLFRWPEILTVDSVVLLWFSLNPVTNEIAGAQIGWRLGKHSKR